MATNNTNDNIITSLLVSRTELIERETNARVAAAEAKKAMQAARKSVRSVEKTLKSLGWVAPPSEEKSDDEASSEAEEAVSEAAE